MVHLFIINPAAGKHMDTEALRRSIRQLMLQRNETWELALTAAPRDGENLARRWAQEIREPLRIYAMGGDGTLNEVVNGVVGFDHVAVGCCPLGSGNDFVKSFTNPQCFYDLAALIEGDTHPIDLISCNGRFSINVASVGFDARIGIGMDRYKRLPLVTGNGAYLISLLVNLAKGIHRPYQIELDGEQIQGRYTLICACNGQWYGGSFHPAPDALLDDGYLDFLLVKGVGRLTVAGLVGKYAAGKAKEYPELIRVHRGQSIRIVCDRPSLVNLDGERLDAQELSFSIYPQKLQFIVPKGASLTTENPKAATIRTQPRQTRRKGELI